MGNSKSLIWTENASGNYSSVEVAGSPSPKRKLPVVLNDDPRSPTISIPRTPIEIQPEESIATPNVKLSNAFSYNNVENYNSPRDDGVEEDSTFIKGNNPQPSSGIPKKGQEGWQRTPLRDYSKPSLFLRYKQAKQAGKSLKDGESLKNCEQLADNQSK